MVLCSGGHNFVGNPCSICRTASRINFFLTRTAFPPAVEGRLVGILRQAVGEICDVAEQFGEFRTTAVPGVEGNAPKETGGSETDEHPEKDQKDVSKEKKKEKKKEKEKKASKESGSKKRERSGVEEAPESSADTAEKEAEDLEKLREEKASPLERVDKQPKKGPSGLQAKVDKYVARHPEKFGLGSLSIRGAAKHFSAKDGRGSERPPELEGLPSPQIPRGSRGQQPRGSERGRVRGESRRELRTGSEDVSTGARSRKGTNGAESCGRGQGKGPSKGRGAEGGSGVESRSWDEKAGFIEEEQEDAGRERGHRPRGRSFETLGEGYSVRLSYLSPRDLETCKGLVVLEATYYHRPVTLAGREQHCPDWRLTDPDHELDRYGRRGTPEVPHRTAWYRDKSPCLRGRVQSRGGRRRSRPHSSRKEDEGGFHRRPLGNQPGEGRAPGRRRVRRAGRAESKKRRGSSGAGPWCRERPREEEKEREGRESCQEAEGQKGKEKGKEIPSKDSKEKQCRRVRGDRGGPSIGWQLSTSGLPEEIKGPVWRNGDRPPRTGAKPSREKGEEAPEEAFREEQLKFEPRREPGKLLERDGGIAEESLFEQGSKKVRTIAEHFPGALASQAVSSMRSTLLQEIGSEDRPNTLQLVAMAYFRQHLQRRAGGPTGRELMTLSHSVDQLLKGRPAAALDTMIQGIKSIEQSMAGSHWTVSQRQEILPSESSTLTAMPEATAAQKEIYQEAKSRWFSSFPEGRAPQGNKGKNKGEGKDRNSQSSDKGKKGGKGGGAKGDVPKKKDA